ncbi:hypothetical protein VTN96DRAFT_9085 [Rasamsonia emersonii]
MSIPTSRHIHSRQPRRGKTRNIQALRAMPPSSSVSLWIGFNLQIASSRRPIRVIIFPRPATADPNSRTRFG